MTRVIEHTAALLIAVLLAAVSFDAVVSIPADQPGQVRTAPLIA